MNKKFNYQFKKFKKVQNDKKSHITTKSTSNPVEISENYDIILYKRFEMGKEKNYTTGKI